MNQKCKKCTYLIKIIIGKKYAKGKQGSIPISSCSFCTNKHNFYEKDNYYELENMAFGKPCKYFEKREKTSKIPTIDVKDIMYIPKSEIELEKENEVLKEKIVSLSDKVKVFEKQNILFRDRIKKISNLVKARIPKYEKP